MIQLQVTDTHIQWKEDTSEEWIDLIAIADLTGPQGPEGPVGQNGTDGQNGADGRSIELTKTETHIKWRYSGQAENVGWTELIAIADLIGPEGPQGRAGEQGIQGPQGPAGPAPEFQVSGTTLQWRLVGTEVWTDLIDLSTVIPPSAGGDGLSAGQLFVARVRKIGEENILGFGFDNGGSVIFNQEGDKFSLAKNYDAATEQLIFEETDCRYNKYKVYKPIDVVQTIYQANPEDMQKFSVRELI